MQLDFEVQRSTRRCAATDRALQPGEACYSILEVQGTEIVRKDYSPSAWNGPPPAAFAWWNGQVPELATKKVKLAPNEVLLELFDQLADRLDEQDMRYVLALLLVRRRVLRLETVLEFSSAPPSQRTDTTGDQTLLVVCPKREATYEVPVVMPDSARIDEIQHKLSQLLTAGAE